MDGTPPRDREENSGGQLPPLEDRIGTAMAAYRARNERPLEPVARAWTGSRTNRVADWFDRLARGSVLYWWLTTPPENALITVDFRETYVAGLVVRRLKRVDTDEETVSG